MILPIILVALVLLMSYLYFKHKENLRHWEKRGIVREAPFFSKEYFLRLRTNRMNYFDAIIQTCNKFPNEPVIGFCILSNTSLLVQDVDFLERILVKDSAYFMDRQFQINEEKNPFDAQLFFLQGSDRWRNIRQKMTPLFTTGKLKSMFPSFEICGESFCKCLQSVNLTGINFLEVLSCLIIDVQGSAVFGIEAKVLENHNSEFGRMVRKVTKSTFRRTFYGFMADNFPKLTNWLGLTTHDPEAVRYFVNILADVFAQRAKGSQYRNDFIQLVVELKQKGKLEEVQSEGKDDNLRAESEGTDSARTGVLTNKELMSQAFSFLTAGNNALEVSTLMSVYALAKYPEVQEKARIEVQKQVEKHSALTFEAISEMEYLENAIKESMRMYPPVLVIFRQCSHDYTFPNGFTVRKGEALLIPIVVVHRNPDYFPEPQLFKPERFEGHSKVKGFMPFGDGPRMCIAMRYSYLLIKYCLANLLLKYRLRLHSPAPVEPLETKENGFFYPKHDILFDLEKLE